MSRELDYREEVQVGIIATCITIVVCAIICASVSYYSNLNTEAIRAGLVQDVVQDNIIWVQKKDINNGPSGVAR